MFASDEIAYFRHMHKGNCELQFNLNYKDDDIHIKTELCVVQKGNDTIGSLKRDILNKIDLIIKHELNKVDISDYFKIPIEFKRESVLYSDEFKLKNLFRENDKVLFNIGKQKFIVYFDSPFVLSLTLPPKIFVGYNVRPNVKIRYGSYKLSEFHWSISKDKKNWEKLMEAPYFVPSENHCGMFLKVQCIPKSELCTGPAYEIIVTDFIEPTPVLPCKPFADRQKFTSTCLTGKR